MKLLLCIFSLSLLVGSAASADQLSCYTRGGRLHLLVRGHADQRSRVPSIAYLSDWNREDDDRTLLAVKDSREELTGNLADLVINMEKAVKESKAVKNPNLVLFHHRLNSYKSLTLKLVEFKFGDKNASSHNPYHGQLGGVLNSDEKVKGVAVSCIYNTSAELKAESAEIEKD